MTEYTRTYSSDELTLEREMAELGENRHFSRVNQCRERDQMTLTTGGRALLRKFVIPVADFFEKWVESTRTGPGRLHVAAPYIERVGYGPSALIAVQVIIDGIHRSRTEVAAASSVGKALENEWRVREMEKNNPGIAKEAADRTKGQTPSKRLKTTFQMGHYHNIIPKVWPRMAKLHTGLICIRAIRECTDLIEVQLVPTSRGKTISTIYPTTAAVAWMEKAEEEAASLSPLYLPMTDKPHPWEGTKGGGYRTDMVLNRDIARFRSRAQRVLAEAETADLSKVTCALNKLQDTPFSVNNDVLECLKDIWEGGGGLGGLPQREDETLPPKPQDIATNKEARKVWATHAGEVYSDNISRRSQRALVAMTKIVATRMQDYDKFYFPHRMDFRGRAYPTPYFLSVQGPDVSRGLVEFFDKEKRTREGDKWLAIHGANVWGEKGTLEHRKDFAQKNLAEIAGRVIQDPLENREWLDAGEPWRFLAWCLEQDSEHVTGLPVSVDASNNGLQLFALMSGDRELAKWTNALPTSTPQDIYTEIAGRATEALYSLADGGEVPHCLNSWRPENRDKHKIPVDPERIASEWREVLGSGGISRACAKRPVMTLPYGVTGWSAQQYVREWYREEFGRSGPFGKRPHRACVLLSALLMDQVRSTCTSAVTVMDWLRSVAGAVSTKYGVPLQWLAPSGWPVLQHYRETSSHRIRAGLASSIRVLKIRRVTGKVSKSEQRNGISPNFVHSVDASVLACALSDFDGPVAAVHDAFLTTAPRVPDLLSALRKAVAFCAIESDPLQSLYDHTKIYCPKADITLPPRFGVIEPGEVLESTYMYS